MMGLTACLAVGIFTWEWTELAHSDVRLNDGEKCEQIPVRARRQILTAALLNVM